MMSQHITLTTIPLRQAYPLTFTKIKKLHELNPDDVEIIAENDDGSICARLPIKYLKISAPRKVSDEQRQRASERFKKLREENHYTQKYVAKYLNVARSTIAGYETKNRQPSHEKLTILAELFHVSVDYLLDDDISEITLSDKSTAQKSEHYLLTHFHRLSNSSKKELLNFLQYLEQRDESARSKSAL